MKCNCDGSMDMQEDENVIIDLANRDTGRSDAGGLRQSDDVMEVGLARY